MTLFTMLATSSIHVANYRIGQSWPWYIIRGAGFAAAALIILLMLSGIGQVTGLTYRFIAPVKAWVIHKALAIALCFAVALHISFLLIDHYIRFSLAQLFVPFLSHYNNKTEVLGVALGWAAVALGIVALYGIAIIVASSLDWIDSKKKTWRKLHYISYIVALMVFVHALYAGSDLQYGVFRAAWILGGVITALAILYRLSRAGSLKR